MKQNKEEKKMNKKISELSFSVELNSNDRVRLTSLNGSKTAIEGSLGSLRELSLVEGVFLEIKGRYGTLRVDLTEEELRKLLKHPSDREV